MIYAHHLEVYGVVLTLGDAVLDVAELDLECLLALLESFEHSSGDVFAFSSEDIKVLFYGVHLLLQDGLLYLQGLRDHPELLVRQNDAIPVVVLDVNKDALAVLLGEIILAGVEYPCIRIGFSEGVGNVKDVGLEPYDHGLICQSEALHLIGCGTHNERLPGPYFMVTDPSTIGFQHPYGIFLTLV